MLKIDEVLKKLEEVDRLLKSADELKNQILLRVEDIVKKHSEPLSRSIEEIINKTISEYRSKVISEAKSEADKISIATRNTIEKIKLLYQERKNIILQRVLEFLSL